ncbi:hypothetical protein HHK36_022188 [Tetracentron sinense]|uniref:Uncharacterized protein n=1 Tax=Tetracentron sinense TaxID=13715 RepID=A0A834YPD8_TETSI|nr:hypothetical protein HHK36_022188 [Tetracentron sinense]
MASAADDLNSSSSDTNEVPFNNKVESGSITFDLDSSTLAISSRDKSPQKVEFKPPPQTLNMSRLEDGTSDSLTALSRSFSIQHGHGESSFSAVGPLSETILTMETRPIVPDRKLLARLVLIREEARNMMGGGILDERNERGLSTLPESEVNFLIKLVALRPGETVQEMIKNVMQGKDEGADSSGNDEEDTGSRRISSGIAGRASFTTPNSILVESKPLPVRPGMFLETVSKVLGGIYAGNISGITAQHLEWVHQKTLQVLQEIAF